MDESRRRLPSDGSRPISLCCDPSGDRSPERTSGQRLLPVPGLVVDEEPEVELPGLLLLDEEVSSSSVWLPLLDVPGDVLEPLVLLPEPEDG
jgi:hypothetical protein